MGGSGEKKLVVAAVYSLSIRCGIVSNFGDGAVRSIFAMSMQKATGKNHLSVAAGDATTRGV